MHGYIVKKSKRQKASNHAGWRPKIGENAGVKSVLEKIQAIAGRRRPCVSPRNRTSGWGFYLNGMWSIQQFQFM